MPSLGSLSSNCYSQPSLVRYPGSSLCETLLSALSSALLVVAESYFTKDFQGSILNNNHPHRAVDKPPAYFYSEESDVSHTVLACQPD